MLTVAIISEFRERVQLKVLNLPNARLEGLYSFLRVALS
jgi:hypothetical protein